MERWYVDSKRYLRKYHVYYKPIFLRKSIRIHGLPWWLSGKKPTCQCRRHKRCGFDPWVVQIPWRRRWQPTPGFLPGKSHGQRSLIGCSPWASQRVRHDWATKHSERHSKFQILCIYSYRHFLVYTFSNDSIRFRKYGDGSFAYVMFYSYDSVECSLPGSSVHEIYQARILEWVAISFSRWSSQPRDRTQVFCNADSLLLKT